jgi:hypothetical protein
MTASPFLTRIESYRDPKALWPLAAGLSGLAHGILILSLQPWAKVAPSVADSLPTIPIQLVALDTRATVFSAPETVPETVPETPLGTPPHQNTALPQLGSPPIPADAQPINPEPIQPPTENSPTRHPQEGPTILPNPPSIASPDPVTQPNVPPAPIPPSAPNPAADSPVEQPARPPDPISPVPSAPTPEPIPGSNPVPTPIPSPLPIDPPSPAGGQLVLLGISATPYGSDWPDAPPQLLSTAEIAITPWLAGCGVTDLGMIASSGTAMRMQIRVRVETDGTISAAYVDTSSGSPALDNLVSCIGQRQLRLAPAMAAGQPTMTDAYQVEVQVQF